MNAMNNITCYYVVGPVR